MAISESHLATAKTILSAVGTATAAIVVVRGVAQEYLPAEFHDYVFSGVRSFFSRFSNQLTLVIDEFDGLVNNEIYEAAETYLGTKVGPTTRRLKISKPEKEKNFNITLERDQEVVDVYNGEKFRWVWICRKTEARNFYNPRDMNSTLRSEVRSFELTFHKKNKDFAINSYLPYIANEAQNRKQEKKTIKIFTLDYENMYNMNDMWTPVTLDHPATFETLAMDSDQKDMILKDLDRFIERREYYRKVGKAWKRGYLLYGPPGTGKSSLIAAMANHLNFDVYDLELTELRRNSELRRLLVATANKSILVVEDIDCTIDLQEKLANRATTSTPEFQQREESKGIKEIGDNNIAAFVDIEINPCGFKLLASNYLGIKEHSLFGEIEDLVRNAKATPAEVAEQLLKNDDADVSLQGLIDFLHKKIKENEEAEAEKARAESSAEKQETVENGESKGNDEGKENSVSSAPDQQKLEGQ
ncbi:UNVERIFIED_CONTAM: protein HYPER-SENSITIVITY-RELATED 4 [Sesamum calycinum]|uniref:Protein HYPER-SENSITIVITY-RELATED 4 n=1 Tax=Sesamum calycinum TaxID=2727403 RepID=A0AAW2MQZ5_9LAMI